jgi:hypothetical protein
MFPASAFMIRARLLMLFEAGNNFAVPTITGVSLRRMFFKMDSMYFRAAKIRILLKIFRANETIRAKKKLF